MAAASSQVDYDFYIISDDCKTWEERVIKELKKRRKGIRCISSNDGNPGENIVNNLIKPIDKSNKVVIGFASESHTAGETEFITSHVIQEMLKNKSFGKLIPVKITPNAVIPESLQILIAAKGWEDTFYEKLIDAVDAENASGGNSDEKLANKKADDQEREEKELQKNEEVQTCTIHLHRKLEFFCQTCKQSSCKDCTGHVHCYKNKHDVITMKTAVDRFNENVGEVKNMTEMIIDRINVKRDTINEDNENFLTYLNLCRRVIEIQEKDIIEKVKEKSRKLMETLENISKERKETVHNEVKDIDDLQTQVNGILESVNNLKNKPEKTQLLVDHMEIVNDLKENVLSDKFDKSFKGMNTMPNFIPSKHLNNVLKTEGIGKIIINNGTYQVAKEDESFTVSLAQLFEVKVSSLAKGKQCGLAVTLMNSSGKSSETEIEEQGNGEYRIKSKCDEEGEWQMEITVNDVHIKGSPVNIKVEKLGLVKTIGNISKYKQHNKQNKVSDVIVDKDGCILVASGSKDLLKFNQSGLFVEMIQMPEEVMVNRMHKMSNGHMVYSEYKEQEVVVCDEKFQKICSFGKGILKYPNGLTVNETTRILYVADREAHCVFKFNIDDGRLLGQIGSEGSKGGQMKAPYHVTLTNYGQVIVADCDNNRIQMFFENGDYIKTIVGYRKQNGKIWGPYSVSIDADENILISSCNKLQLFDKNGDFKKRIDNEDDGLNVPAGISILSSRPRKVVVANHGGNDIRILNY